MPRISKKQKLWRVFKRKLLRPLLFAVAASVMIYIAISSVVTLKKVVRPQAPQFMITRISDKFEETEYMHLLLTVQELEAYPNAKAELVEFVNGRFPAICPRFLESHLRQMNWAPQAFLIRVKTMFKMLDIYDRMVRLDETIAFLSEEIRANRLPYSLTAQVEFLQKQRDEIIGTELTEQEYEFIKDYNGIIQRIKKLN